MVDMEHMESRSCPEETLILIAVGNYIKTVTSPLISTAYQARKPFPNQARNPSSSY
jgi:hypothetical protein